MSDRSIAYKAAMEIGHVLNESHCSDAPIHGLTHALLGDAQDFGDILEAFAQIVAPIIQKEIDSETASR